MRIISKFKDYYDTVQAYGQDDICVYHRVTNEFDITDKNVTDNVKEYFDMIPGIPYNMSEGKRVLLGFCGKIYPVWKVAYYPHKHKPEKSESEWCYSSDEIEHFMKKYKRLGDVHDRFVNPENMNQNRFYYNRGFTKKKIDIACELFYNRNKLEYLFFDYKAPIFIIEEPDRPYKNKNRYYKLITNPNIRDYKFFKQKDTFTTYQDISMYISGILGLNDPDIVHISDRDMKDQKGFYEYSFKTLPTKKR
jgi:hypothetical protein